MPQASPRTLSNSFPKISQFRQVAQRARTHATPPCRYFCSELSKTFSFQFSFHAARASSKSLRAPKFGSEDFVIEAGGTVRPCARCAIMPPRLIKPIENVHLQAECSCSACLEQVAARFEIRFRSFPNSSRWPSTAVRALCHHAAASAQTHRKRPSSS